LLIFVQLETSDDCTELQKKLRRLQETIPTLPASGLHACADYVMFPLLTLLKFLILPRLSRFNREILGQEVPGSDKVIETLLECLALVLKLAGPWDSHQFLNIFNLLMKVFELETVKSPEPKLIAVEEIQKREWTPPILSEEAKMALLACISNLLLHYDPTINRVVSSPSERNAENNANTTHHQNVLQMAEFLPSLGYVTYKILEMSVKEKNRELKRCAIETIHTLLTSLHDDDIIATFFPGIINTLFSIISGDYKQGQNVFVAAFRLLKTVVVAVLNDNDNPFIKEKSLEKGDDKLVILRNCQNSTMASTINQSSSLALKAQEKDLSHQSTLSNEKPNEKVKRTKEWYAKATYYLHKILVKIFSITRQQYSKEAKESQVSLTWRPISYDQWRVRFALVECANEIATKCGVTLSNSVPILLETIVLHIEDDYLEIAEYSRNAIASFSQLLEATPLFPSNSIDLSSLASAMQHSERLKSMLETNFLKLIKALPRLIRDPDDTNKSLNLRLLNGYIQLLRAHISTILSSSLSRISFTLLQILEFDDSNIRIVEQRRILSLLETSTPKDWNDIEDSESTSFFYNRKLFKHFRDERIIKEIVKTCRLLGTYGDPWNLIDYFVDLLRQNERSRKQVVFILNELVLGIFQSSQQQSQSQQPQQLPQLSSPPTTTITTQQQQASSPSSLPTTIQTQQSQSQQQNLLRQYIDIILTEYLSPEIWSMPLNRRSDNIDKQNDYITLSCLLLEGINHFAQILKGEFIHVYLMRVLYPILEKLGDESEVISQAARVTLQRVFIVSQVPSVSALLTQYADYVIDMVSRNLKFLSLYPTTLNVLYGLLNYAGRAVIPLLDDVLACVFSSLADRASPYAKQLLKVLDLVVSVVRGQPTDLNLCSTATTTARIERANSAPPEIGQVGTKTSVLRAYFEKKLSEKRSDVEAGPLIEGAKESTKSSSARDFFVNYHTKKQQTDVADFSSQPSDYETRAEDVEDEECEAKKATRKEIEHIKNILQKVVIHHLSSRHFEIRLLGLDIIEKGIWALVSDPGNLLPTVHNVWEALKPRFIDEDPRVLTKALGVMRTLSIVSKEFLARKFSEDLWPYLKNEIKKFNVETKEGRKFVASVNLATQYTTPPGSINTLKYNTSFRTQCAILDCLITATQWVQFLDKDTHDVATTCYFYLSRQQPHELQQRAVDLYKKLMKNDGDYVWLFLVELANSTSHIVKPSPEFRDIVISPLDPQHACDYQKNVDLVLNSEH